MEYKVVQDNQGKRHREQSDVLHVEEEVWGQGGPAQQKTNHTISRLRERVEHIFARLAQIGANLCRTIGLERTAQHNHLANLVYNPDRYALLSK